MKKHAGSPLVFLSGIIVLISGALNIIAWLYLYNQLQSTNTPPEFLIPFLENFMNYLSNPFLIIKILLTIAVGIILIVASKKMKKSKKIFGWSVASLVLGLVILFELHGGGVFGGITAGILSSVGGIFGLIESTKKS